MNFLNTQDHAAVSDAIREQEQRTAAEIVTVVIDASDSYNYIPVLWAALISMMLPCFVYLSGALQSFVDLFTLQVLLFVLLAACFRFSSLKYKLVPKSVKQQRAARMARQQFFAQKLHHTEQRLGVLLFVSVAERYVEILADSGVSEKIPDERWQETVQAFTAHVAQDQVVNGFLDAIKTCGDLLAEAFPDTGDGKDELPNHLIVLAAEDDGELF